MMGRSSIFAMIVGHRSQATTHFLTQGFPINRLVLLAKLDCSFGVATRSPPFRAVPSMILRVAPGARFRAWGRQAPGITTLRFMHWETSSFKADQVSTIFGATILTTTSGRESQPRTLGLAVSRCQVIGYCLRVVTVAVGLFMIRLRT